MSACGSGGGDAVAAIDTVSNVAADDNVPGSAGTGTPTGEFPGRAGGTGGQVTAIDDATLIVESQGRNGTTTTLTVQTSDETAVTTTIDGAIQDVAVGDQIVAIGEAGDDEFVATVISEGGGAFDGAGFPGGTPGERPEFPDGQSPDGSFPTPPEGLPEDFPQRAPTGEDGAGPAGQGGGPAGGGFVTGTITDVGDSTITIKSEDGTETVVRLGDDLFITVAVDKQLSDIELGTTIRVSGETTDDVVVATSIVIVGS